MLTHTFRIAQLPLQEETVNFLGGRWLIFQGIEKSSKRKHFRTENSP
jgi:hypothetical protein